MDYQHTSIYVGLLALITYVSGESSEQYRCPNTDRRRTQSILPYNGRCYQFVHEERYWTSARDYCRDHGGRLVTINDARTNEFVTSALSDLPWSNKGVWIGLHDRDKELHWEWSTESDYVDEPLRFTNWARGHPKAFWHSIRDCVRIVRKTGWKWHETPCSALKWKYRFICEYGMQPETTPAPPPTYPPGFHEALRGKNSPQGWARPAPPDAQDGDIIITADDVMIASTTKSPVKARTTTKPEFYEEDSMDVLVPMQLTQERGKDDGRGNMIFGIVGCVVGVLCILAFLLVILLMKRRRHKQVEYPADHPAYGATEGDDPEAKVKGLKVRPGVTGGRVMNIYTNPSDVEHMTALQRLHLVGDGGEEVMMLMSSGSDSTESETGSDVEDENVQNERLEDASEYLEPSVCMAHRPLPEVTFKTHQGQEVKHQGREHAEVKVKRKPQRFVRPKSPVPVNSSKEFHHAKATTDSFKPKESEEPQIVENLYEDAEDVDENVYAEIPGDNIYETLDEMKKSLATMGEAEA